MSRQPLGKTLPCSIHNFDSYDMSRGQAIHPGRHLSLQGIPEKIDASILNSSALLRQTAGKGMLLPSMATVLMATFLVMAAPWRVQADLGPDPDAFD